MAAQVVAGPARADDTTIAGRDGFRIGDAGVTCNATRRSEDPHYESIFDRGYEVLCRDAASPVGKIYALAGTNRIVAPDTGSCGIAVRVDDADANTLAGLTRSLCHDPASGLQSVVYRLVRHGQTFTATGLSAYDSALRLGLATLAGDRPVKGIIDVAVSGADDPTALARMQAERFDPAQALAAGITRANDGDYANAAEFFDRLNTRARHNESGADRPALYLAGLAIEQSNLGNQIEASALFARAAKAKTGNDPVFARLYRNLYAMHRLDTGDAAGALATLDAPLPLLGDEGAFANERLTAGYIDHPLAVRLSIDDPHHRRFGNGPQPLSDGERAQLLDAQALYLRAEAHRLTGHTDLARIELPEVIAAFGKVRDGRVVSMAWLPANVFTAQAAIAESDAHLDAASQLLQKAVDTLAVLLPDSPAWLGARARQAGFMARHGQVDAALVAYAALVRTAPAIPGGTDALRGQLNPYFTALLTRADQIGAVADAFAAAQTLVRPGVAQTQAVLARELSGGSDQAAGLFRQSLGLAREVRAIDQTLASASEAAPANGATTTQLVARRAALSAEQTNLQAQLAGFPRYLAVNGQTVSLDDLRKTLRPGEAYYKLMQVGGTFYAFWIEPGTARFFKLAGSPADVEMLVNRTRDSIVSYEGNQLVTSPFDLESARHLYTLLFDPVGPDLARVRHLVFEPDGAMLKLPVGVLVVNQTSIAAYDARARHANADAFDMTGIAWLARDHTISTAVSVHAFTDVRALGQSSARFRYLGMGHNAVPPASVFGDDPCGWPRSTWGHPVDGAELTQASVALGGAGNEVIAGARFSDSAIMARNDLDQFRVIQFATHGLVTAPRPGCLAEPALVTSFAPETLPGASKGLLTFREIFNLRLNADTVILSACDTAGAASVDASRAAGLTTGGNFALDGLVRAFVGAGARSVVASHWPVPDDFNATSRLIGGLVRGGLDMPIGEALRQSEIALMDDPLTSHPYYWAAFAIVGDAAKPMTHP